MTRTVFLAFAVWASIPSASAQPSPSAVMLRFEDAWNRSDAEAISELFSPDADFVTPDGMFVNGPSRIAAYYSAVFADGFSGSKGVGGIIQQRSLSPDFVVLDGHFSIRGAHKRDGSKRADGEGLVVVVLRREGSAWRIVVWRERSGSSIIPFPAAR